MNTTVIAGAEVSVDDEGFMTNYDEWTDELGRELAANIGIAELTAIQQKALGRSWPFGA